MGSAPVRPLRDLFIDRRNLHAIPGADEKRSGFSRSRSRRLVERRHRHGSEARTSRAVRSPGRRSLPAPGLERCRCLRLAGICPPERNPLASRDRRHSLLSRRRLSCLAELALSQRNLAWLCAARGELPLFGDNGLLAIGYKRQLNAQECVSPRLRYTGTSVTSADGPTFRRTVTLISTCILSGIKLHAIVCGYL